MMPYGKVFQGNFGRQPSGAAAGGPAWNMGDDIRRPPSNPARPPMPTAPQPGRIMDGPGSGFTFPGNNGASQFAPGRAQPIQEPSQGTPYAPKTYGIYAPGTDITQLPYTDTMQPNPGYQPKPGSGGGSGSYYGAVEPRMSDDSGFNFDHLRPPQGMGDDIRRAPDNRPAPRRPAYNVPGYDNQVLDPMVAQNEYDRIAREQRAAARGDKPRKTQMELDMEMRNQEHNRTVQQRSQVQSALPGVDQATQKAIRQRINAYGETPEQAYQNGGFAARAAQQQQAQQRQDLLQQGAANPAGNWRMPPTFR